MQTRTQVLIVGAGPVGLLAALCLARRDIDVVVADQQGPAEAKSFAVVLHPRTVALLGDLEITAPLLWQGQSLKRVAIYTEGQRRALLEVPVSSALAEGGLTLPQNVLRSALEDALRARGVEVKYQHRLSLLESDTGEVRGTFSTANSSAQHVVKAEFVIGADGHDSSVRSMLGIPLLARHAAETYAFFDVPRSATAGRDVELVFDHACSGVFPLRGDASRYTFELKDAPPPRLDASALRTLLRARMPWHAIDIQNVEWAGVRKFQRASVDRFGVGRVWLAGDAAHTANPLGSQSLNVGMREARDLANRLAECPHGAQVERLQTGYDVQRNLEWRRLMALDPPSLGGQVPVWARPHVQRLLTCLPASGDDLDEMLAKVGVTLP